ncbi:MAG TPA: kinase [Rhodobacteraceae bacterium]|nr:kinase [Paracoccaceae bacterium]
MSHETEILCIGSVLWDVIGRSASHMRQGADVPGRISRQPGGVAMNIAMALRRFDLSPALLTTIGSDDEGRELLASCKSMGLNCNYIYISEDLPTDRYMAIEAANGLIAAIADAHSLEAAGDKILRPLSDGRLGSKENPFGGVIALDGNLTLALLENIAHSPLFRAADLRVAPASSGKAERLAPLLKQMNVTAYVNLQEAGLLCQTGFGSSALAAAALIKQGAHRVLVTDGAKSASIGTIDGIISQAPPKVLATRVTGAGDTFMAAHIAAEMRGDTPENALKRALDAAATYVSGETPL